MTLLLFCHSLIYNEMAFIFSGVWAVEFKVEFNILWPVAPSLPPCGRWRGALQQYADDTSGRPLSEKMAAMAPRESILGGGKGGYRRGGGCQASQLRRWSSIWENPTISQDGARSSDDNSDTGHRIPRTGTEVTRLFGSLLMTSPSSVTDDPQSLHFHGWFPFFRIHIYFEFE